MQDVQIKSNSADASQTDMRLPDFFIIGAAKCGTTTLYRHLCRHPKIYMSTPKEVSFFCDDDIYAKGMEWYARLFVDAQADQLCGEASTTYSRWPFYKASAERLACAQPNARLIYILRDPADRLYSFYGHRMREDVTTTFEDFVAKTPEAVDSGRYMTQLKQYLQYFSEDQILVLFTEDLRKNPQATLDKTRDFLGLQAYDFLSDGPIKANEGGGKYFAAATLTNSISTFKKTPGLNWLLRCLPPGLRQAGYQWLANGPIGMKLRRRHQERLSPITPQLRKEILELYQEDIEELEEFTGRCLTAWKNTECIEEHVASLSGK